MFNTLPFIAAASVVLSPLGPHADAYTIPAESIRWSDFSLPWGVELHAEHEMLIDGVWQRMGRNHLRVTQDWVESRQWSFHADIGEAPEVYVHASVSESIDYRPESRRAGFQDLFERIGTAVGGSGFTPYDSIRTLLVSQESGRPIRVQSDTEGVRYHYTRMDYNPEYVRSELVVDHDGRVREHIRRNVKENTVTSHARASEYAELEPGVWFPMKIEQRFGDDAKISVRWRVIEAAVVQDSPVPPAGEFPAGTRFFNDDLNIEIDQNGNEIQARSATTPANSAITRWVTPSSLFAVSGAGFLILAAWVYRRRASG